VSYKTLKAHSHKETCLWECECSCFGWHTSDTTGKI